MNKEKTVHKARSKEEGIIFYSNKNPMLCYEATIDEKGKIKTEIIPSIVSEIADAGVFLKDDKELSKKLTLGIKITICVVAILSIFITKKVSIAMGLAYFAVTALKDLMEFCKYAYMLKLGKYKSTGRFHSAEHMVINAYQKKQRIPTMKELKKASRYDEKCGSRKWIDKITVFGMVSFVISLCNFINQYQYVVLLIITVSLAFLQGKYEIFKFLQIFLTNKPTEKELEVALAGIEFFEKEEEKIPEDECPFRGMLITFTISDDEEEDSIEN